MAHEVGDLVRYMLWRMESTVGGYQGGCQFGLITHLLTDGRYSVGWFDGTKTTESPHSIGVHLEVYSQRAETNEV